MKKIHLALYSFILFLTAILLIPSTVLAQDTTPPNAPSIEDDNSAENAPAPIFDTYNKNHLIELTIGISGTHQNGSSSYPYVFSEIYDIALNYKHPLASFYRMGGGFDVAANIGHDVPCQIFGFNWLHEFIVYHSTLFIFSVEALIGYIIAERSSALPPGPSKDHENDLSHGFQLGLKANFNWRLHPLFSLGFSVGIKESLLFQIPYDDSYDSNVFMETFAIHAIFHI